MSIIIPVYNNDRFVEKCIRSVVEQTYNNLQIIIVNDGSTDGSYDIIKRLAEEDCRIDVINQENKGVSAARNAGLEHAKGDYLTFVDGDDYISSDYIYNLMQCALENHAEMVITGLTMVRLDESVVRRIIPGEYIRFEHEEWTFRLSAVAAHMYETELWRRHNVRFHEGERGEDMPVSLFFSGICERISILQKADYYYVQHEESAMHSFKKQDKSFLPYNALESTIVCLKNVGVRNSKDFHELFVLRIMASMINIAKGATKEEIRDLSEYIHRIIAEYYPECGKNPYTRINSGLDIPFMQRVAVKVLISADKRGVLFSLLKFMCR